MDFLFKRKKAESRPPDLVGRYVVIKHSAWKGNYKRLVFPREGFARSGTTTRVLGAGKGQRCCSMGNT